MSILYKRNSHEGSEREMQDDVVRLIQQNRKYNNEDIDVFEEIHIPEIGRRSDIIIRLRRTYFNVECKMVDVLKVLEQARDHLKWANYSYICLRSDAYIAPKYIREMTDIGIGLLLWEPGVLMECVQAPSNRLKNRVIREKVIERLSNQPK